MANLLHSRVQTSASELQIIRECLLGYGMGDTSARSNDEGLDLDSLSMRLDGRTASVFRPIFTSNKSCVEGNGYVENTHRHFSYQENCESLQLFRSGDSARCEVYLGSDAAGAGEGTRVISVVRGRVVAPYPDRPSEGMLQINAAVSPGTCSEAIGAGSAATSKTGSMFGAGILPPTSSEIVRHLERVLKDSEAIDLGKQC